MRNLEKLEGTIKFRPDDPVELPGLELVTSIVLEQDLKRWSRDAIQSQWGTWAAATRLDIPFDDHLLPEETFGALVMNLGKDK